MHNSNSYSDTKFCSHSPSSIIISYVPCHAVVFFHEKKIRIWENFIILLIKMKKGLKNSEFFRKSLSRTYFLDKC